MTRNVLRKGVSGLAGLALAVGVIGLGSPPAQAAVGDLATSVVVPVSGLSIGTGIALGPDGNIWSTNATSQSISRVAPSGGLATTFATPTAGKPVGIAAGPDGAMWFTYLEASKIGRITMNGTFTEYPFSSAGGAISIALGPDGNMWFTLPTTGKIGRITPTGTVTEFDAGVEVTFITAGPSGSNRMYFGGKQGALGKVGFITMSGAVTLINTGPTVQVVYGIATVEDNVWFIEVKAGPEAVLARLIGDTTIQETVLPSNATNLAVGANGTFYATDVLGNKVMQFSSAGALQGTYNMPAPPLAAVFGPDGNLWIRLDTAVSQMLTGVVPALSTAPAVTPAAGVTVGSALTTSNGTWKYAGATYTYAWQRCTSTDVATCAAIAGATAAQYTAASDDNGKYLRSSVTAANANGASQAAFSALVQVGSSTPPAPPTPPAPAPATGPEASIGSGATAEIDLPSSIKRGKRGTLEVIFTVTDVQGTVTFTITKGSKSKTITGVAVSGGQAATSWKVPSNWPKGTTTVNALFTPATGSPYQGANVKATTKIK